MSRDLIKNGSSERVLAIGAHPDDVDFRAGGTLARYRAEGAQITIMVVTDGERGSWDEVSPLVVAQQRLGEQADAAAILQADLVVLHHSDGAIYDQYALRQELCLWYRVLRPTVVISHDPWRRYNPHPDHRLVGWASCQSVVASRNANYYPEQLAKVAPWGPQELLLFMPQKINYRVDISLHIDTKVELVTSHRSQLPGWASKSSETEPDTELAVRSRILELAKAAAEGLPFTYGEEFHRISFRPIQLPKL